MMENGFLGKGAVVLAGGKSTRMGKDKRFLSLGGETVLERMVRTLARECGEVQIAFAADERAASPKGTEKWREWGPVGIVYDPAEAVGPLGGMLAGFRIISCPYVLVAAADMPFPSRQLIRILFERLAASDVSAIVPESAGRLHPLFAVYRRDVVGELETYVSQGGTRVMGFVERIDHDILPEHCVLQADPTGRALFNMNTPEDYLLAQTLEKQG